MKTLVPNDSSSANALQVLTRKMRGGWSASAILLNVRLILRGFASTLGWMLETVKGLAWGEKNVVRYLTTVAYAYHNPKAMLSPPATVCSP